MSYRDECMELAAVIATDFPEPLAAPRIARLLLRDAAVIQRHAVNQCNRETSPQEDARARQAADRILTLLAVYPGVGVMFGGDPRGYCVKLTLPSKRYNNWGGETWGIPTQRM
jgi:hypothetical protein